MSEKIKIIFRMDGLHIAERYYSKAVDLIAPSLEAFMSCDPAIFIDEVLNNGSMGFPYDISYSTSDYSRHFNLMYGSKRFIDDCLKAQSMMQHSIIRLEGLLGSMGVLTNYYIDGCSKRNNNNLIEIKLKKRTNL